MWGPDRLEARINLWLLLGKWRRGFCLCRHSARRSRVGYKAQTFSGRNTGRTGCPQDVLGGPSGPPPAEETSDTAGGELRAADIADLGWEGTDPRGCQHRAWRRARAGVIGSRGNNMGLCPTQSSALPAPRGSCEHPRACGDRTDTRGTRTTRASRPSRMSTDPPESPRPARL